jgi:hypothetical protein
MSLLAEEEVAETTDGGIPKNCCHKSILSILLSMIQSMLKQKGCKH